ncbi:G-type lectin S-receptor-like serine/threonine-protein kinase At1g34300 [Magnolia sinica]|uniref:G-type lectin S-receptor-like serine/threonine-protein kinase At1g34300 n=1 Tax=Magnolia sinica TaxID=86752 RepID=UPI002658C752|nr:G-type lectin S-receptor-like serine/threonine-protein kinase At1g34300 [Magnolia sinica]
MQFHYISFLLTILPLFSLIPTLRSQDISVGSTLRPTNLSLSWPSPNGTFSFQFLNRTEDSSFIAAISYSGGIAIWKAGGADARVDIGGALEFLSNGNLRLINGSGTTIWQSNTTGLGITSAALEDTGNFVLKNGTTTVWSTFENPTDTILQDQNFTMGKVLRSGRYSFNLLKSGNLTLQWGNSIIYWNQGLNSTFNRSLTSPSLTLQSVGILRLYDLSLPGSVPIAYSSDYGEGGDTVRFLRLDSDGNLRAYSSVRGSGVENPRWAAVLDQCQVFGWCGNMGICSYNDTEPLCGCPSLNFEFVDPNNQRMGCRRKQAIADCPGSSTMLEMSHTQFLTYPPELSNEVFFVGITACRLNCLGGGSCVASTSLSDGSGLCFLKVSDFVSGYQSPALPSTSFVKVCAPAQPNQSPPAAGQTLASSKKLRAWVVAVVVLGTILALVFMEFGLWWCCCRNSPKFGTLSAQYALLEYASGAPVQFSYKDLQRATKGFREKLGAGGFGAVYRGVLANRTVVAVKQLEGIEQGEKQFRMEVATISSTHHLNLVRLIGFCSEGRHRLLVYEFMRNGSLDNFLFSDESLGKLDWGSRFNIALGTARGITYLHEECRDCIVHCDIKPENILLDENYNAKVSDFGLAKLVNPKDHRYRTLTSVRGTRGYLAPEWLANLPITSKSDVYSYGMVLLEIVSGRRNFDVSGDTGRKKFSVWAYEEFDRGSITSIVDKRLADEELDVEQLDRVIQVSFWCIQEQPSQRPTMGKVVQMLEGIMTIEKPPAPKAMEGSLSSTSGSANVSALSTFAASAPAPSSSSSLQALGSSSLSGRNIEKTSSSLLG